MIISKLVDDSRMGRLEFKVDRKGKRSSELWCQIPPEHSGLLSDRLDGALVALLVPAMLAGEDLVAEGTGTDVLIERLNDPIQTLLRTNFPQLSRISVHASHLLPPAKGGKQVAAGFSGGIDSFTMIRDHYLNGWDSSERIDTLLFTNVGSHGSGGTELFHRRGNRVQSIARRLGLPLVMVDTNLDSFYQGISYERSHVLRNASVAHLLQGGVSRWWHASTYAWSQLSLKPDPYQARIEPLLLALLCIGNLSLMSTGSQYTRLDKYRIVASMEIAQDSLDVCVQTYGDRNCGRCPKCGPLLLAMELLGTPDVFAEVFDMAAYRSERDQIIGQVLTGTRPQDTELRALMRTTGHGLNFTILREATLNVGRKAWGKVSRRTR